MGTESKAILSGRLAVAGFAFEAAISNRQHVVAIANMTPVMCDDHDS